MGKLYPRAHFAVVEEAMSGEQERAGSKKGAADNGQGKEALKGDVEGHDSSARGWLGPANFYHFSFYLNKRIKVLGIKSTLSISFSHDGNKFLFINYKEK